MPYRNNIINPKTSSVSWPIWVVLAVAAIVIIMAGLELSHTTHIIGRQSSVTVPTAGQNTKGESATNISGTPTSKSATTEPSTAVPSNNPSQAQPGDNKSSVGGSTSETLAAPSGNFISAHKGISQNANLSSVCNTTAGAFCNIEFTLNGVTKSLAAQLTDRGGSTYWNSWTPGSIGLTPGTWQIRAVATLQQQTKSTNDALDLEVIK